MITLGGKIVIGAIVTLMLLSAIALLWETGLWLPALIIGGWCWLYSDTSPHNFTE